MAAETNYLAELTRLAGDYAPFFFAVLFLTLITRAAHGYYSKACTRTDPPANEIEQKTYRLYFLVVTGSSIILVMLAIIWFAFNQMRGPHTFQIAITELEGTTKVESGFFSKITLRPRLDATSISDVYLLIVQEQPFMTGAKFPITVWLIPDAAPGSGASTLLCGMAGTPQKKQLEITYRGKAKENFQVRLKAGVPELVSVDAPYATSYFSRSEVQLARAAVAAGVSQSETPR